MQNWRKINVRFHRWGDCLFFQITTRPIMASAPPIHHVQFIERIRTHLLSAPIGTPQLSSCNHVSSVSVLTSLFIKRGDNYARYSLSGGWTIYSQQPAIKLLLACWGKWNILLLAPEPWTTVKRNPSDVVMSSKLRCISECKDYS